MLDDFYGGNRSAAASAGNESALRNAVRVDFFDTPEQLYVAELTFNTGVGNMTKQSKAFYLGLGDLFILPE